MGMISVVVLAGAFACISILLVVRQHNAVAYQDATWSRFIEGLATESSEGHLTPVARDSSDCTFWQDLADGKSSTVLSNGKSVRIRGAPSHEDAQQIMKYVCLP